MHESINEKVSIILSFNRATGLVMPRKMHWQGKDYRFTKLAYHHKKKHGNTLLHVFDMTDGTMDFRLVCNTDNLQWTLEDVADGND